MRKSICLAVGLAGSVGWLPAFACVYPPPSVECLEKVDVDERRACSEREFNIYMQNWRKETEARNFEEAQNIYLARIIRSEEIQVGGSPYGRQILVQPYEAIRGELPLQDQSLKDRELTSCGLGGDGWATWGNVSDVIIVFDGVEPSGMTEKSTTFSMLARSAQHPELVEAWTAWKEKADFTYDVGHQNGQ